MRRLNELLNINSELEVSGVSCNTQTLAPGELFLCTKGATVDRHDFIAQAAEKGAAAVVVRRGFEVTDDVKKSVAVVEVDDVDAIADSVFAAFWGNPQNNLKIYAVTGTDGKTSVSTIIQQLLGAQTTGNIGTNGMFLGDNYYPSWNTTPDSDKIYQQLDLFLQDGATAVSMEFSSEAQHFNRLRGLRFDVLGLTNITSEHLNTHGTLENYFLAKTAIFLQHLKPEGIAVLNADDSHFSEVKRALQAENIKYVAYGSNPEETLQIVDFKILLSGTEIVLKYENIEHKLTSPLLGDFNVENLCCAILMLLQTGLTFEQATKNLSSVNISGRLDVITEGQNFGAIVDYAHTPNGLKRMFNFVKRIPDVKRIITVIGQAGERDKTKRPEVGKIVVKHSDLAIFTEEDPKNEPPQEAVNDIVSELSDDLSSKWIAVLDRREAIGRAVQEAQTGDLILVLGKGNEDFHKVGNVKLPWSDEQVLRDAILA